RSRSKAAFSAENHQEPRLPEGNLGSCSFSGNILSLDQRFVAVAIGAKVRHTGPSGRAPRWTREDGRVIRFSCPGCRSVLSCRTERAGKTVTCPKCPPQMQVPCLAPGAGRVSSGRNAPITDSPGVANTLVVAVVIALLLASLGGGTWLLMRSISYQAEPVVATNAPEPAPASRPTEEKPANKPE